MKVARAFALFGWLSLQLVAHAASAAPADVQIEMRHVRLHVDDDIVLDIASLRGAMVSRSSTSPAVVDDERSYVLAVQHGDISMSLRSLETLLRSRVFASADSPLRNVRVRADGGRLKLEGTLHKGIAVPFSATASLSATDDGRMRLHVDSMKTLGIPVTGLLKLFGLTLDEVAKVQQRGVSVHDDDVVITPGEVLPPPEMKGRLTHVEIRQGRLYQTFDAGRAAAAPRTGRPSAARNYIYFSGGTVTFGKLTMRDADLQLIDEDPHDPFDFFPAKYDRQLVAGYSKNTPAHGLRTYMPDFDDLPRTRR